MSSLCPSAIAAAATPSSSGTANKPETKMAKNASKSSRRRAVKRWRGRECPADRCRARERIVRAITQLWRGEAHVPGR